MSTWVNIKRVTRYGFIGFIRNGFVSLAAVLIMTITLFVLASVIIFGAALKATLQQVTENVDVAVYFLTDASLGVRAKQTSQYESIATFLENRRVLGDEAGASIDKINFFQNKEAIDRLTSIINT